MMADGQPMKARDIYLLPAVALLGAWALSGALYGSPAEPVQLRPAAPLTLGPVPIDLGDHAIPCVTDWNGDGRKDLLVGTGVEGQVFFYRNLGADAQPVLATGVRLLVGSSPLTVPARATPYVHDWDEDGLPDLLCGAGDGQVYFFKNVGSHPSPVLQAPVPIKAPVAGSGLVPINTGYRMRLELVDWNNDTVTDLLVGSHDGRLLLYEGYRFALTSLEVASSEKLILRWSSAPFLNYQVLAGPSADAINVVAVTRLASEGTVTSWTNLPIGSARYFRVQVVP